MASRQAIISLFAFFTRIRLGNPPAESDLADLVGDWDILFGDIQDQEFSAAGTAYARVGRFWPSPADVLSHCPSLKKASLQLAADNAQTGRDIWPSILREAGSIGWQNREWPLILADRLELTTGEMDRVSTAILAAGGWKSICTADHDAQRREMGGRFRAAMSRASEEREVVKVLDFGAEARRRLGVKNGN
jgi:hypothetical protein